MTREQESMTDIEAAARLLRLNGWRVTKDTGIVPPPVHLKLHYARAQGATFAEMRANVPKDLRSQGDAILCWVNEGDVTMLQAFGTAIPVSP